MKTLYLEKVFPDGRKFYYHQIYGVEIPPEPGILTVVVGSWYQDPTTLQNPFPDAKTNVVLTHSEPVEEVIPVLLDRLVVLPDWAGTVIES